MLLFNLLPEPDGGDVAAVAEGVRVVVSETSVTDMPFVLDVTMVGLLLPTMVVIVIVDVADISSEVAEVSCMVFSDADSVETIVLALIFVLGLVIGVVVIVVLLGPGLVVMDVVVLESPSSPTNPQISRSDPISMTPLPPVCENPPKISQMYLFRKSPVSREKQGTITSKSNQ